ncbi:MAG: branched-chain amino acid ABC transporter permease [Actinomycetota bacterium]|nr:branched-chain amino acid ABC transporter permease [Actinomycetota bacterium]
MSETRQELTTADPVDDAAVPPESPRATVSDEDPQTPPNRRPPRGRGDILRWAAWVVLAVVLLALPLYVSTPWLRVGEYVMIGAVTAIGLTLLTGQTGQLSLGTPFFMLVGGTSYVVLAGKPSEVSDEEFLGFGLPPMLALVLAVVVAAIFGLAFAPVAGRVKGIYLAIATLSLVYLGLYLGQSLPYITGGTASGRNPEDLTMFGFSFTSNDPDVSLFGVPLRDTERMWWLFLVLAAIAYVLAQGAIRGRPGRSWRAVRDNESAAAVMGVRVPWVRASVFAISSAYAGLAGVMTVLWFGLLKADETEFAGTWSIVVAISVLAMIIIGGLGSVPGAVVGAMLVNGLPLVIQLLIPKYTFLRDLTSGDNGFTPVVLTAFVYGLAIIAVVLFEPGGLAALGRRFTNALTSRTKPTKGN